MTLSLGFLTLNPLSAAVLLALLACVPILLRRMALAAAVDLALVTLAGAVVGGRALHVLLNGAYFSAHPSEALSIYAGGLSWHGAVIGGLAGVWVALWFSNAPSLSPDVKTSGYRKDKPTKGAKKQKFWFFSPFSGLGLLAAGRFNVWRQGGARLDGGQQMRGALLDTLALVLPVLALAAWAGCGAVGCGYGAEVPTLADYPAFAVSESRDVYGIVAPRWNTPLFGVALAVLVGLVMLACAWRGWARGRRVWLALALLSAGMFALGFVRGDSSPILLNLRADQILDLLILAISIQRSAFSQNKMLTADS